MLPQFARAESPTTGDLFLGLGYVQDSTQSIRDGVTVKANESPFVELFGPRVHCRSDRSKLDEIYLLTCRGLAERAFKSIRFRKL